MFNKIPILVTSIFLLTLISVSAGDFGYTRLDTETTNYSSVNVNNSQYLQGYTPTTLKDWMQGFFDAVYCQLTGCTMTGDIDMDGNNIDNVNDLDVNGNATFTGSFETNCFHCEDNETYFHSNVYSEGNITAPNIEVMESLIVHGNSTCTGTATACGDIGDSTLCGYTTWTGQRGCRWRVLAGDCIGTATPCDEMSTATCEEQHVCSLTSDVGFIFGADGFTGNITFHENVTINGELYVGKNIDVAGNITADWFKGKFNWTSADDWNIFDGSTLEFNESKLETTYYNGTQASVITGTILAGSLENTQHPDGDYDGITFNFSEEANSPGLDLRVNFTGINSFNGGVMRYYTNEEHGDPPLVQLWSYTDSAWHDYPYVFESSIGFTFMNEFVYDSEEHIGEGVNDGVVQMRIYLEGNGNTNDEYYIDWIAIFDGYATPSGNVDLTPYWKSEDPEESRNFHTTGNLSVNGTRNQLMPNLWTCQLTPTSNPIITSNLTKSIEEGKC